MTHKTLLLKLPNQSPESRLPPEAYLDETPFHEFKSSFRAPKNSPDTCPGGVVHSGHIICRADASSGKKTSCKKLKNAKYLSSWGFGRAAAPPIPSRVLTSSTGTVTAIAALAQASQDRSVGRGWLRVRLPGRAGATNFWWMRRFHAIHNHWVIVRRRRF